MKIRLLICTLTMAAATLSFGQGQNNLRRTPVNPAIENAPMYTSLYVLKSDLRSIELDPKRNEIFDVRSVDRRYVKFVTVLSGKEGRKVYGEKGANGVIIVQLADHFILSKETLINFNKVN